MYDNDPEDASETAIGSFKLDEKQVFYYLFDFGDEWWHEITVEKTGEQADDEKYPRIIEKKGESPEQYGYDDDYDDDCE